MDLLNKLSKKDAMKFSFAVSFDSIDNFKPPAPTESGGSGSTEEKKKSGLKGLGFGKKKSSSTTSGSSDDDYKNMSYAIFWKRGANRTNHTDFIPYNKISNGKLVVNETFKITGTMFQNKPNKFVKKKMEIEIHEKTMMDPSTVGEKIASGSIDLADFVSADKELTKSADIKMDFKGKSSGTIRLTVSSVCLKDLKKGDDDFTAVSTYTGADSEETGDDATDDDDSQTPRKNKGKGASSEELRKLQTENEELQEQIEHLQRKIQELETTQGGNEDDSSQLISDLQREREELRQKLKKAQIEVEDLKEERDRAQSSLQQALANADKKVHEEQLKSNTIRQKMQKVFGDKSTADKELQKMKSELDATAEKIKELEKENLLLAETAQNLEIETEKLKKENDILRNRETETHTQSTSSSTHTESEEESDSDTESEHKSEKNGDDKEQTIILNQRIEDLEKEIEKLTSENEALNKTKKQVKKLEATIEELKSAPKAESKSSSSKVSSAELDKLAEENAKLKDAIAALEEENKELNTEMDELEEELNGLKGTAASFGAAASKSTDMEAKYKELEKKYKEGLKLVKNLESQEKESAKKYQKTQQLLEEQQSELEERDREISKLKKKMKAESSSAAVSSGSDATAEHMEELFLTFMEQEIVPMLSHAVFKNQQQYSTSELVIARFSILKTLLSSGMIPRSFLDEVVTKLDEELFGAILGRSRLDTNDGFLVKMTISVFENFIIEEIFTKKERSESDDSFNFFQKTRQCADICVLQQATVLQDEMRQIVCPSLNISEVREVCQKLGL